MPFKLNQNRRRHIPRARRRVAYLTDVLQRVVSGRTKAHKLGNLLPWNWRPADQPTQTAAA